MENSSIGQRILPKRDGPGTLVLAGAIAQRPAHPGHAWVFLQYLLGFRRLGWQVLFVDWLDETICSGPVGQSRHANYLRALMERFGLDDSFSLLDRGNGQALAGLPRHELLRQAQNSALLLNVMGYLDDAEILASVPRRVFLDIDPGFPQMWRELGLADPFSGHDDFVTIGERIGREDCTIPTAGLDWITTRPPIVLERWPRREDPGSAFTSVASWRGPFGPVEYAGKSYGLRVHEFRKFLELPRRSDRPFELALDIHPDDERDRALLEQNGWVLVKPVEAAGDPDRYQAYIASSLGELMVAKGIYVETRSGWFSDRSACYLASGRPVLAQDTGLEGLYPLGEGLLPFRTIDDALAAVEVVCGDYARHAAAARAIAEEHFDSDIVLTELLASLG
ncbi:MAG TPA: hypothetical protein VIW19_06505 [Gaiellaceae bacterium]